jgi:threonine/homoserine/homoserine lactone efflux protein
MDIVIPNATSIGVFAVAAMVLLLTPGPAVLYIVSRSVEQGRIAGLASVCGITTGTLVHVLAAALGLSALLASSALAFAVVKYAGAGYLIYIGVRQILSRADTVATQLELPRRSLGRLYRDGFVVNLLNPKTALFFLALLPVAVTRFSSRRASGQRFGHTESHYRVLVVGGISFTRGRAQQPCAV